MINWTRIDELLAEIGTDGVAEVVELFLDEVEVMVMQLGSRSNAATLESDLHFLKGGAWNLGFTNFGGLCQDGERKAAAGRIDEIDIEILVSSYFESKAMFMDGLASRGMKIPSAA